MQVYFDSSVFAKRYVNEPGTAEVLVWCDQAIELAFGDRHTRADLGFAASSAMRKLSAGSAIPSPQMIQQSV